MTHPLVHAGTIHLRVGKNGITDGLVADVQQKLKHNPAIALKLLPAFTRDNDRKEAASELAQRAGARVEYLVGGLLILARKR